MTNTHENSHDTPAATDLRARKAADLSASKSRKECLAIAGWGATTQISKENAGFLHRFLLGSAVRITTDSLYDHLIDLANAPARQGRKPSGTSFQKKRRAPTERELEGLRKGNQQRAAEAQQRRGATARA